MANCLKPFRDFSFRFNFSHIEGNLCSDKLANIGFQVGGFIWCNVMPNCIKKDIFCNIFGFSNFVSFSRFILLVFY